MPCGFEDSVISCVYILQVDIACSTEATDISKLIRVIQRGVKSEKTTPGKSGHCTVVPVCQRPEIRFNVRNDFIYQNGRELGTEFCSGIGKAFARLVLNTSILPLSITTIMGLALPSAIRLSMMKFILPWLAQLVSFSPIPCCRYSTGYFWKDSYHTLRVCRRGIYAILYECRNNTSFGLLNREVHS